MKTHSPVLVADCLIARSGGTLTPLQVIKLVYIAHGYSLALLHKPLIKEAVEAWRYGPVVPSVYHGAKKYGGKPIDELLYSGIKADDAQSLDGVKKLFDEWIHADQREILDGVFESYGDFTGLELVEMTHDEGSPWDLYYRRGTVKRQIPDDAIKAYYAEVVKNSRD